MTARNSMNKISNEEWFWFVHEQYDEELIRSQNASCIRIAICSETIKVKSAWKAYQKAQDEVARLESFLRSHIAHTTRETIQAIKQEKTESKIAYIAHDKAKQEVNRLQTLLDGLSQGKPPICAIWRVHNCRLSMPGWKGQLENLEHRFTNIEKNLKDKRSHFNVSLRNFRVMAFHDAKVMNKSEFGNGRSSLRSAVGVDDNGTKFEPEEQKAVVYDTAITNSWKLVRERSQPTRERRRLLRAPSSSSTLPLHIKTATCWKQPK